MNAHIGDEHAHVRFESFEHALRKVRLLGRGCWLAKVDWKAAFRQIAVRMADWPLLGLTWRGVYFVRLVLPFGARSSPRLFTEFAAVFRGVLLRCGARHVVFYLDDFHIHDDQGRKAFTKLNRIVRGRLALSIDNTSCHSN